MTLTSGTHLGPYEILGPLGAGGMGEVYRARDTKLGREVALKLLPPLFAGDPDRLVRFEREARMLAALNHPNIAHVHGLEDSSDRRAIVMELVEGQTLAERIARGAVPLDEALPMAKQLAEALEYAHDHGVVHRDLKPANIKITPEGTVKVLDFGLAKALEAGPADADPAHAPTSTSPAMTGAGVILGTAAYMSPEQARGAPLDRRTDIWAFGCVLYEMLTGRRTFEGASVPDVMASVLTREPDFAALPVGTPPSIRRLLRRALRKERHERLRDIGDARLEIGDVLAQVEPEAPAQDLPAAGRGRPWFTWLGTAAVALALVVPVALFLRPVPVPAEMRVEVSTPPSSVPLSMVISPDGRIIAFVATSEDESRLWLRSLDSGWSRPVSGTEGAESPFWSPDSRSVGFFADGKLKRIDVGGGSVQTLTHVSSGDGGTWNRDDVILFASLGHPIARISAKGGEPVELPQLTQQGSNFSPQFLPDGHRFLYYVRGTPEVRGIYVGQLDGAVDSRRLLQSDTGAVYAPSGQLLFVRENTLLAQDFDPVLLKLTGEPFQVAEHVASDGPAVSVSDRGTVAYRMSSAPPQRQFVWFDRSGRRMSALGNPVSTSQSQPSLSPDGQRVVLYRNVDGNTDIWFLDTKRGTLSRFTSDPADDVMPVWSPDGTRVVFSSNRQGTHDLYEGSVTGGASEERLYATPAHELATDWSHDGRYILFTTQDPKASSDIWALRADGTEKPFSLVQTPFDEQGGQFSPDGHWIAYQSNESGRTEVYLQPFPGPGSRWLVSTEGGTQARWARDGKELFYIARNGRLMAVPIRPTSTADRPDVGTPVMLFAPPVGGAVQQGDFRHHYVVAPDGQRFLVAAVSEQANPPIILILNWRPRRPTAE